RLRWWSSGLAAWSVAGSGWGAGMGLQHLPAATRRVKRDSRTFLAVGEPDPQRMRAHEIERAAIGDAGHEGAASQRRGPEVVPVGGKHTRLTATRAHRPCDVRLAPQRDHLAAGLLLQHQAVSVRTWHEHAE